MTRILALQHSWDDPIGSLGEIMQAYAVEYVVVDVEKESIPELTEYAAIIALGGPQHVYDIHVYPYLQQEVVILRQAVAQDIPVLGICLGGQLLAYALGGAVKRHDTGEIGFFDVDLTEEGKADPLYQGLPGQQTVFHWHEDSFELPAGARRLATSGTTQNQAFRYGTRAYGTQYHIELTPLMLDAWLHNPASKKEVIDMFGFDAYNAMERNSLTRYPVLREHTRVMFENFLKISKLI